MQLVGWCKGVVYLMSLGRPTDIGLQLSKACCHCSRLRKRRGGMFFISSVSSLLFLFLFLPSPSLLGDNT